MMGRCKFDIVALSETWLKDIKSQLEYVLDGCKSKFKNRESKSGGGVGFYKKEHVSFTFLTILKKLMDQL